MKTTIAMLAGAMLLAGCGSGNDQPSQAPQAPKRQPMELDPSPPMGSADIDMIVNQHRSAAAAPATNGNTSGKAKGN